MAASAVDLVELFRRQLQSVGPTATLDVVRPLTRLAEDLAEFAARSVEFADVPRRAAAALDELVATVRPERTETWVLGGRSATSGGCVVVEGPRGRGTATAATGIDTTLRPTAVRRHSRPQLLLHHIPPHYRTRL